MRCNSAGKLKIAKNCKRSECKHSENAKTRKKKIVVYLSNLGARKTTSIILLLKLRHFTFEIFHFLDFRRRANAIAKRANLERQIKSLRTASAHECLVKKSRGTYVA